MPLYQEYESILQQHVNQYQFLDIFKDNDECLELYFRLKFKNKECGKCGRSIVENYQLSRRGGKSKKAFRCRSCKTYIYPLSDTAFRKTTIPLNTIFFTMFSMVNSRNSISAIELTKFIPISYKTAHKLMMAIRRMLYNAIRDKMSGFIEVDEVFVGKGNKVYNWGSISTRKQPIVGLYERESKKVRFFLVKTRNAGTLTKLIFDNVEEGSTVYTDCWRGYNSLSNFYTHETVDHKSGEYVRGNVHTNSIENVWRHLKRNLRRAHIKISEKYIQEYLNEACFRHNSKGKKPMELFNELLIRSFFDNSRLTNSQFKLLHIRKVPVIDSPSNFAAV